MTPVLSLPPGPARRTLALALIVLSQLVLTPTARADAPAIEFNRDIRPILAENCFACHGPDGRNRKAGLRLDDPKAAAAALENGHRAIVPGAADDSELVFRIESDAPEVQMPPPRTGKVLTDRQRRLLREWVEAGAPYESHWSLTPVKPRPVPAVASQPATGPIDAFIDAALAEQGLTPAPEADRVTLARRLSLDLTGLPPEPGVVEAFRQDSRPDAYLRLVDRLLASPQYGERMALFWLDLVRYADSVGYHGDQPVSVSPYRDYVIDAFNQNVPFDRFTIEQLAGDLMPEADTRTRIAAGYNRLGMMSAEGGVQPKEYLAKYAAERVRNVSGTWLGVTLGCSECHDHKYDPFATREFYSMEAFFADIKERGLYDTGNFGPTLPVPTPEQARELDRLDRAVAEADAALDVSTPELISAQADWERTVNPPIEWVPLAPLAVKSSGGSELRVLEDGSVLASGPIPTTDTYSVTTTLPIQGVTAIRLEALPDPSLPASGPGRFGNGNFVLTELRLSLQRGPGTTPQPLILENGSASFEQTQFAGDLPAKAFAAALAVDGKDRDTPAGWAILGDAGSANTAVFETAIDLTAGPEAQLTFDLAQVHPNPGHTLGRFRLSVAATPRPVKAPGLGLPRPIRDLLTLSADRRDSDQAAALARFYRREVAPALAEGRARLAAFRKERAEVFAGVTTTLITETVEPREIRVLARGNWMDDSGEVVTPGVPAVLNPLTPRAPRADRLDLARWLVAPENPLTPRVLANRLWKLYFGAGLSRKLDDLGSQGEWPSHPELLDHLARELVEGGWDLKAFIRQIVTSAAYRRSAVADPATIESDPTNRWLAHQNRFRLDAELVRDATLQISGLLASKVGGPSVKPPQPPGYWSFLNFPTREWQKDAGDRVYRRGLYVHWQRQYLYPSLLAFDAPSREECTAERGRSNTPLQALTLLNDPVYVEAARALAEHTLHDGGPDPEARIDWLFRRALSRSPREAERAVLGGLLAKHLEQYRADVDSARKLLTVGERPPAGDLDPAELAAWTDLARVVLNLHATITRN